MITQSKNQSQQKEETFTACLGGGSQHSEHLKNGLFLD